MKIVSGTYVFDKIKGIFTAVYKKKDGGKVVVQGKTTKECDSKVKNNKVE